MFNRRVALVCVSACALWAPASAGCFDNLVQAGLCGADLNKWTIALADLGVGIQSISDNLLKYVPAEAWDSLLKNGAATIDKMNSGQIQSYLTVDKLSKLSQSDWENLLKKSSGAINNFSPAQVKTISVDALKTLSSEDWKTLLNQGTIINNFSLAQVKTISADALKTLSPEDWEKLLNQGIAKINDFTPEQVKTVSNDALSKLKSSDIQNIAINTLKNMDKAQIEAIWDKLSPEQKASLDGALSSTTRSVSLVGLSVTATFFLLAFAV